MADILPRVEGGRAQIANVPGAVLPNVSMPTANVSAGYEAASRYSGSLSNVIDQLSNQMFGMAEKFSQKAGLQYAAENGLTQDQLTAIAKGDVSSIQTGIGSDFNVFSAAVKKYRALEVSGYAEIEARNELLKLHARAEAGEDITASDVQAKVAAILKGPSEALTQIDPEASLKYRATIARLGGDVIKDIARLDANKRIAANGIKENVNYQNTMRELEVMFSNDLPVDRETGTPFPVGDLVNAISQDLGNKALILGGADLANKRVAGMQKDIDQALTNALTKKVLSEKAFTDPALKPALRSNDMLELGRLLTPSGAAVWAYATEDVKAKVRQALTIAENDAYIASEREAKRQKDERLKYTHDRLIEYYETEDTNKRLAIARDIAQNGSFTNEELAKYLDPKQQDGDEYVFGDLWHQVSSGAIEDRDSLKSIARRTGMSGKQYTQLVRALDDRLFNQEEGEASREINAFAGVADVVTARTQGDEARFDKRNAVRSRYIAAKKELARQGKSYSPRALALEIIGNYRDNDAKDINKNAARDSIKSIVDQAVEDNKKRGSNISINTDSLTVGDVNDLEKRKILDSNQALAIRKKLEIINKVQP
jgi:hypothetical protein